MVCIARAMNTVERTPFRTDNKFQTWVTTTIPSQKGTLRPLSERKKSLSALRSAHKGARKWQNERERERERTEKTELDTKTQNRHRRTHIHTHEPTRKERTRERTE